MFFSSVDFKSSTGVPWPALIRYGRRWHYFEIIATATTTAPAIGHCPTGASLAGSMTIRPGCHPTGATRRPTMYCAMYCPSHWRPTGRCLRRPGRCLRGWTGRYLRHPGHCLKRPTGRCLRRPTGHCPRSPSATGHCPRSATGHCWRRPTGHCCRSPIGHGHCPSRAGRPPGAGPGAGSFAPPAWPFARATSRRHWHWHHRPHGHCQATGFPPDHPPHRLLHTHLQQHRHPTGSSCACRPACPRTDRDLFSSMVARTTGASLSLGCGTNCIAGFNKLTSST